MDLYDQLASKARLDGESSAQLRSVAQKNANAIWVYVIMAGMVWYFFAWYWALIPAALAILATAQSISATAIANRLEKHENS